MGVIREPMVQTMKSFNIPVSVLWICWWARRKVLRRCLPKAMFWKLSEATHAILSSEKYYSAADIMSFTLSLLPVFLISVIIVGARRNFCGFSFDFSSTDVATIIAVFSRIWSDFLGFSLGCRSELIDGDWFRGISAKGRCELWVWFVRFRTILIFFFSSLHNGADS